MPYIRNQNLILRNYSNQYFQSRSRLWIQNMRIFFKSFDEIAFIKQLIVENSMTLKSRNKSKVKKNPMYGIRILFQQNIGLILGTSKISTK